MPSLAEALLIKPKPNSVLLTLIYSFSSTVGNLNCDSIVLKQFARLTGTFLEGEI